MSNLPICSTRTFCDADVAIGFSAVHTHRPELQCANARHSHCGGRHCRAAAICTAAAAAGDGDRHARPAGGPGSRGTATAAAAAAGRRGWDGRSSASAGCDVFVLCAVALG